MGYAVRDFFLNGGSQAIAVRLFRPPAEGDGMARFTIGGANGIRLRAANPGVWGEQLRVSVDPAPNTEVATRLGVQPGDLFNLTVTDNNPGGRQEQIRNLTVVTSSRRIDNVLAAESNLVRWDGVFPATAPTVTQGTDAVTTAEKQLQAATAARPQVPADITTATALVKAATAALGAADSQSLNDAAYLPQQAPKTGIFALDKADLFNMLCIPPDDRAGNTSPAVWQGALEYCVLRRAMLMVDSPVEWSANPETAAQNAFDGLASLGIVGTSARNAALYFPRVFEADPLTDGRIDRFVPCGLVAGAFARMDGQRGVWKAPAGLDATLERDAGARRGPHRRRERPAQPRRDQRLRSVSASAAG